MLFRSTGPERVHRHVRETEREIETERKIWRQERERHTQREETECVNVCQETADVCPSTSLHLSLSMSLSFSLSRERGGAPPLSLARGRERGGEGDCKQEQETESTHPRNRGSDRRTDMKRGREIKRKGVCVCLHVCVVCVKTDRKKGRTPERD